MSKRYGFSELAACTLCVAIFGSLIMPIFAQGHPAKPRIPGLRNARLCIRCIELYAVDNDDIFPYVGTAKGLVAATHSYMKDDKNWSTLNSYKPDTFKFNSSLPGVKLGDVPTPAQIPMIFDIYGYAYPTPVDQEN